MDKLNELTLGEKVAGASGILLLLFSFFTWFKKSYGANVAGVRVGGTYNGHNGWGGVFSLLGVLVAVALVVVIVLRSLSTAQLPEKLGNLGWPQVYLIAGGASFVLVLLQIIIGQSIAGTSLDRSLWAYLGLVAAAGVGVGSYLNFQQANKGSAPGTTGGV